MGTKAWNFKAVLLSKTRRRDEQLQVVLGLAVDSWNYPHLTPTCWHPCCSDEGLGSVNPCGDSEIDKGKRGSRVRSVFLSIFPPYLKKRIIFNGRDTAFN